MAKYDENGFIVELEENEIFVFGSNLAGRHGAGAAKQAREQFGAVYGQGEGLQGQSYAFPTLDESLGQLSKLDLRVSIAFLNTDARSNPDKIFLVTKVGCGLGGFTEDYMINLFREYNNGTYPLAPNLIFPDDWTASIFN